MCEGHLDQYRNCSVASVVEDDPMEPMVKPRHPPFKINTFHSQGAVNSPGGHSGSPQSTQGQTSPAPAKATSSPKQMPIIGQDEQPPLGSLPGK